MTIKDFKAIIFDMDGLLVDSETVWYKTEKNMIESRGYEYTDEVRDSIVGMRVDEFLQNLHAHYGLTESVEALNDQLISEMLEVIPVEVLVQPGADEMLQFVVDNDIPHAIASSSPMSIIDATLEAQGWDSIFARRFSADDDEKGKPAPDVYLRAMRELGFEPHECLALEDSPNGSRAAVAAGMTCYSVPDKSHTKAEAFKDITPHVFKSLHDVLAKLKA